MLGKFITFEGANGVGKTTYGQWLALYLRKEKNIPTLSTQEPRGLHQGCQIFNLLKDKTLRWSPMSQCLLYCTARYEHVTLTIQPNLKKGTWVICDRFYDSTIAYQGYAHGLDLAVISTLHQQILGDFSPQLTFILDLDPEIALQRKRKQHMHQNVPYEQDMELQHRIRQGYLQIAKQHPKRCVVIHTDGDETRIKKKS